METNTCDHHMDLHSTPRGFRGAGRAVLFRTFLLASVLLAACGGGSSGDSGLVGRAVVDEQEPNETPQTATALNTSLAAHGTVSTAADIDFWSFHGTAGQVISVEMTATRLAQGAWDALCNVPQLTLWMPDGVTRIVEHDYAGDWMFGRHDLDFPLVGLPQTGTYYLCVISNSPGVAGAEYALTVRNVAIGTLQGESEATGQTGANDGPVTANTLTPGTLYGFHLDGNADWYKFTVAQASAVCFELVSSRNGLFDSDSEYYRPRLNLYEPDGSTLIASVDGAYFDDPLLCARLDAAGTYFVEVTQSASGGDAPYFLRFTGSAADTLPIETEPNDSAGTADALSYGTNFQATMSAADMDYYSFSGLAGDQVLVEVLPAEVGVDFAVTFFASDGVTVVPSDSDTAGGLLTVRTILPANGTYFFRATGLPAAAMTYVVSFARRADAAFESEPNDDTATSDTFNTAHRAAGVIDTPGDVDVFGFSAKENELVTLSVLAARTPRDMVNSDGFQLFSGHGSTLKPRVRVLQADGTPLATSRFTPSDDCVSTEDVVDGLPCVAVSFIAPMSETYYLEITAEDGTNSASHVYAVTRR